MDGVRYCVVAGTADLPELGRVTTYGIAACRTEQGAAVQLACVPDISPHREEVAALARRCSLLELDPCHLWDVVLDSIS